MDAEKKEPKTAGQAGAEPPVPEEVQEPAGQEEKKLKKSKKEEELQKKLEETQAALEKQKDQFLRTAAEYDNYRKRSEREKTAVYADATAAAVKEILAVQDNLERALAQENASAADLHKGVEMVKNQMDAALSKLGVTAMGAAGEAFDPEMHNAVSHIEDEAQGENVISEVFQKGYKIGDKVIRHAMVVVAN